MARAAIFDGRGVDVLLITMNIKQSVFIKRPTEEIFAYISDLENLPEWSSVIVSAKKISPGAVRVGTAVRSTVRFLGKWFEMVFEIIEHEPNRYLTIKSTSGISPVLFCYQFDATEHGGTLVSQEAVIHSTTWIAGMEESVIKSATQRQIEYDLQTLKEILEARTLCAEAAEPS